MIPHERSLVAELAGKPFAILGVNSDPSPIELQQLNDEAGVTWRSFFDGGGTDGPIATQWGVRGWPTIFVLDAEGVIRFKNVRGDDLEEAVKELLAELDDR